MGAVLPHIESDVTSEFILGIWGNMNTYFFLKAVEKRDGKMGGADVLCVYKNILSQTIT